MTYATVWGFAVFLIILFEMFCFRNSKGLTFWERYGDTPAMYLAIALVFAHCLGFGCYVIVSIIMGRNTLDPADNTDEMPKALKEIVDIFFWPHAVGMMICMIATVLQFVPQIRVWKNHAFHRWNGWLIVVAGTIGVLAAFVINTLELYIPNRYGSPNTSIHFWMESLDFYVAGVGCLTSSTLGAYYAVARDIPRHAAWMHRLVAWWFSASAARIYFVPLFGLFTEAAGFQAAPWMEAWTSLLLPVLLIEIWIQYSGRFEALKQQVNEKDDVASDEAKLTNKAKPLYNTFSTAP
eukprot:CAMPEP_0167780038 /NCGR_PEP_ID=MMETSP0111_2-20121227/5132_1 /TAXON_ID=91324 /ORGANISM="Lotharella globosa, Strain CCCM811" /LENGTH=293 /DNA_ID=CAMNT_0007670499 /DNA_START=122 /DNA_END=1003 /DNA_ORIENTATION=+